MYSLADKDFKGSVRQSSLVKFKMLGISLQAFSQKRQPIPIFLKPQSKVTISQMCNFPIDDFPKVMLGLLRRRRLQVGRALQLGWDKGPNAAEKTC